MVVLITVSSTLRSIYWGYRTVDAYMILLGNMSTGILVHAILLLSVLVVSLLPIPQFVAAILSIFAEYFLSLPVFGSLILIHIERYSFICNGISYNHEFWRIVAIVGATISWILAFAAASVSVLFSNGNCRNTHALPVVVVIAALLVFIVANTCIQNTNRRFLLFDLHQHLRLNDPCARNNALVDGIPKENIIQSLSEGFNVEDHGQTVFSIPLVERDVSVCSIDHTADRDSSRTLSGLIQMEAFNKSSSDVSIGEWSIQTTIRGTRKYSHSSDKLSTNRQSRSSLPVTEGAPLSSSGGSFLLGNKKDSGFGSHNYVTEDHFTPLHRPMQERWHSKDMQLNDLTDNDKPLVTGICKENVIRAVSENYNTENGGQIAISIPLIEKSTSLCSTDHIAHHESSRKRSGLLQMEAFDKSSLSVPVGEWSIHTTIRGTKRFSRSSHKPYSTSRQSRSSLPVIEGRPLGSSWGSFLRLKKKDSAVEAYNSANLDHFRSHYRPTQERWYSRVGSDTTSLHNNTAYEPNNYHAFKYARHGTDIHGELLIGHQGRSLSAPINSSFCDILTDLPANQKTEGADEQQSSSPITINQFLKKETMRKYASDGVETDGKASQSLENQAALNQDVKHAETILLTRDLSSVENACTVVENVTGHDARAHSFRRKRYGYIRACSAFGLCLLQGVPVFASMASVDSQVLSILAPIFGTANVIFYVRAHRCLYQAWKRCLGIADNIIVVLPNQSRTRF